MVNYIKEYFKNEEHDLTSLIGSSSTNNDDKIKEIKRQINKLQKDLELKTDELHKEVENVYANNFVPLSSKVVVKYDGRTNGTYFDLATGLVIDELQGDEDMEDDEDYEPLETLIGVGVNDTEKGLKIILVGYNNNVLGEYEIEMNIKGYKEIELFNVCYEISKDIKDLYYSVGRIPTQEEVLNVVREVMVK